MTKTDQLYVMADELRAIATMGLRFDRDVYTVDRYHKILDISARIVSLLENRSAEEVRKIYDDNLLHVSPVAGVESLVLRDGNVLLMKRTDNGLWCVPGGVAETGETIVEAVKRELLEEVGVEADVERLLGVFDSRIWPGRSKVHLLHYFFLMKADDPDPVTSNEASEVGFFTREELPPLSPGHDTRIPFVLDRLRARNTDVFLDGVNGQ